MVSEKSSSCRSMTEKTDSSKHCPAEKFRLAMELKSWSVNNWICGGQCDGLKRIYMRKLIFLNLYPVSK